MTRFTICLPAGPGTRFAQHAFASNIGKRISVTSIDGLHSHGILEAASVTSDGSEVLLTVDVTGLPLSDLSPYSIDSEGPT